MITRQQVIFQARKWLETPYKHQGRARGRAADCLFPLAVCEELGIKDKYGVPITGKDYPDYSPQPKDGFIHEEAVRRLLRKSTTDLQPGDFVTLRYGSPLASHCGIIGEFRTPQYKTLTLIHCDAVKVVEHALSGGWKRRLVGAFAFPEVH